MEIKRQEIKLAGGILQLTCLNKNRLILAELIDSKAGKEDILAEMGKAGFRHGIIDDNIELLSKGHKGQVPLARAEIIDLPVSTSFIDLDPPMVDEIADTGRFELLSDIDVSFPVKAGDVLLTLESVPTTIIRFPDGNENVIREHKCADATSFSGKNSTLSEDCTSVVADIDGMAHRTASSSVAVYPPETVFGIGSSHGEILKETALIVEQDISEGSHITTESNLIVKSAIRGAYVRAAGNLQVAFNVDNPYHDSEAKLIAGQSVRCQGIEDMSAWAGSHFFIVHEMNRSKVQCLDTIIVPVISGSEVTVGNRLVVRDITDSSRLKIGAQLITDPEFIHMETADTNQNGRLNDIEQSLIQHRFAYNKTRESILRQIERIRDGSVASSQRGKVMQMIIRLMDLMGGSLESYKEVFDEYVSTADEQIRRQVAFDNFRSRLSGFNDPYIRIFGTMDAGTVIESPGGRVRLKEPFSNGHIGLEPLTGNLKFEPAK